MSDHVRFLGLYNCRKRYFADNVLFIWWPSGLIPRFQSIIVRAEITVSSNFYDNCLYQLFKSSEKNVFCRKNPPYWHNIKQHVCLLCTNKFGLSCWYEYFPSILSYFNNNSLGMRPELHRPSYEDIIYLRDFEPST